MNRRTILFVMTAQTLDAQIAQAGEVAAEKEDHLTCLILAAAPALPVYAYGVPPYGGMNIPDDWTNTVNMANQRLQTRVKEVEAILGSHNVSGNVVPALCATLDVKHHVARFARISDEAFFAADLRDAPEMMREAVSGVLFHSPIALRMNGALPKRDKQIFVAWDSSEAAASAVHAALPYLKKADEVAIACIDPVMTTDEDGQDPGTDVAAWLSHHGCNVTVSQFPSGGLDTGTCIQNRAREFGADLVVMGAYGHARMIQTVLGGTTRSMLDQTELPVLLAH